MRSRSHVSNAVGVNAFLSTFAGVRPPPRSRAISSQLQTTQVKGALMRAPHAGSGHASTLS